MSRTQTRPPGRHLVQWSPVDETATLSYGLLSYGGRFFPCVRRPAQMRRNIRIVMNRNWATMAGWTIAQLGGGGCDKMADGKKWANVYE